MTDNNAEQEPRPEFAPLVDFMGLVNALSPRMPAQQLQLLIYVLLHPGCTTEDLMRGVNVAQSSVSRNMNALGRWRRPDPRTKERRPGLGFVETRPDAAEPRRLVYYPTPLGEAFGKLAEDCGRKLLERTIHPCK